MFGVSSTAILEYLLSTDTIEPDHVTSLLRGSLKKKADSVLESIDGNVMQQELKQRIRIIKEHMQYIDSCIDKIDALVDKMVTPYDSQISLLRTISSVDRTSAITIISEIGIDMSQFTNVKRICCWAGLTPSNNESAGKKKSVRITRAGAYLKPALVQVAYAAVKDLEQPYYKIKYERIQKRRGKKRAIKQATKLLLSKGITQLSPIPNALC